MGTLTSTRDCLSASIFAFVFSFKSRLHSSDLSHIQSEPPRCPRISLLLSLLPAEPLHWPSTSAMKENKETPTLSEPLLEARGSGQFVWGAGYVEDPEAQAGREKTGNCEKAVSSECCTIVSALLSLQLGEHYEQNTGHPACCQQPPHAGRMNPSPSVLQDGVYGFYLPTTRASAGAPMVRLFLRARAGTTRAWVEGDADDGLLVEGARN